MAATVAQMTAAELRTIIEAAVEEKLLELLGDPDDGLVVRKSVRDRLLRQREAVASGDRGHPRMASTGKARLGNACGEMDSPRE